ncbi:hypothetical protein ACR71G_22030 [Xenorhabdus bovienii]|uniref:hypothetical protein n=1 Tax=Xenorhabdus bovienii TaxID=40576 RepID=UPI003DA65518
MNDKDIPLENILDNFFFQSRKQQHENFRNNRQPKQRPSQQERDTVNVFSSFVTAVNKAPSSVKPVEKQRHRQSTTVTARG